MNGRSRGLPGSVGRAELLAVGASLVAAELVALLLVVRPALAFALTGALVAAVAFLYVRRPAVFLMVSLPVLPLVNYAIFAGLGTGAAIATVAALVLIMATSVYRGLSYGGRITWSDAAVVGFAVFVLASTIRGGGGDGDSWRTFIGTILPGALAYFALRSAFSAEDFPLRWLWWGFVGLTAALALMGLYEGLTGTDLLSFTGGELPVSGLEGIGRPNGPFATDIEFALTLVLGLALLLSGWDRASWETPLSRRAAAIVTALAIGAVYFTYFRTAWVLTLLLMFMWMRRRNLTTPAVLMLIAVPCVAILAGLLPRLGESSIVQTRVLSGENVSGRVATNRKAIEVFRSHPLAGIGWANFETDTRVVEVNGVESIDTPHNAYLGVLAELGLIGVMLFGGAVVSVIAAVVRLRRMASQLGSEVAWAARGLIWVPLLFLVFSVDFQTLTLPYPTMLFFGCGGIAAGIASLQRAG